MIVYLATNTANGKLYIGQTSRSLARRKGNHRDAAERGKSTFIFHKAIKKYGFEAFDFSILQNCCGRDCLNHAEKWWIAQLNTMVPHGYNLTTGGEGATPSEETKKKMSEAMKKRAKENPELMKRISDLAHAALRGKTWTPERRANHKPLKMSEEHKAKIRAANVGRVPSVEERRRISEGKKGKPRPDMIGNQWHRGLKSPICVGKREQIKLDFDCA